MSENLFFIPILAKALRDPDIERSLRNAFFEIKKMGTQRRYAEGFENFELFIDAAYSQHEITTSYRIRELTAQLATGIFEGTAREIESLLDIIRSHPQWQAEYEAILRMEADEHSANRVPVIEVASDKGLAIGKVFRKVPGCESFEGILPGGYKIKLVNTGWIIWEGELTAKELILTALPMAAETERIRNRPTKRLDLLNNGELILRTYPGRKEGRIEIELTK
ncbi:MAG: hypothetical protein AMJ75_02240 [Phycisphaerae bacterium SM1_79]|nr:MAG: hypothetical protein AMJ75_02240 [Phycisphaerae bacterium SM1_79]